MSYSDEPQFLILNAGGKGEVKASAIKTTSDVEIVNPDQVIATLDNDKVKLGMEIKVEKGRGYVPVESRESEKLEVGMIAVDALLLSGPARALQRRKHPRWSDDRPRQTGDGD